MRRLVILATCVLACKSDKPTAGTGSSTSAKPACALLVASDIAAVVGNPVKDGVSDGTFFCKYLAIDPPGYDPSQGKPAPPAFDAHTFYAHDDVQFKCEHVLPTKPGNPKGAVIPVPGLGDQAAWEWNPGGGGWDGALTVCEAKDVVQISLVCTECKTAAQDEHRPKLESLMKTMLGRL